ncbi:MAG TPA: GNAT family N-acetyltransferase [Gaiellaceae bacterium]|nr:GNAT family N-acetyltransferase [Gaiellaceae bacterium]
MSVEVREPRHEEVPALAAMMEEHALRVLGESETSEAELREWLVVPQLWMRIAERDGCITGYLDVVRQDESHSDVDARGLDRATAEALLGEAQAHVREAADGVPQVLHGVAQGDDDLARGVYEDDDWQLVRSSFRMLIDLGDELSDADWPEGLTVRNARPDEAERVYEAHMDAFADHWDFRPQSFEQWRSFTIDRDDFDPSLWWLAEDGDELAGLSLNRWHFSGDPEYGWVEVLGVRPPWRKRGLGAALLRHSFQDFRARGATRVGLGVDAENTTGAVRLYERVGMRVVRRNDIYEKTL